MANIVIFNFKDVQLFCSAHCETLWEMRTTRPYFILLDPCSDVVTIDVLEESAEPVPVFHHDFLHTEPPQLIFDPLNKTVSFNPNNIDCSLDEEALRANEYIKLEHGSLLEVSNRLYRFCNPNEVRDAPR